LLTLSQYLVPPNLPACDLAVAWMSSSAKPEAALVNAMDLLLETRPNAGKHPSLPTHGRHFLTICLASAFYHLNSQALTLTSHWHLPCSSDSRSSHLEIATFKLHCLHDQEEETAREQDLSKSERFRR